MPLWMGAFSGSEFLVLQAATRGLRAACLSVERLRHSVERNLISAAKIERPIEKDGLSIFYGGLSRVINGVYLDIGYPCYFLINTKLKFNGVLSEIVMPPANLAKVAKFSLGIPKSFALIMTGEDVLAIR